MLASTDKFRAHLRAAHTALLRVGIWLPTEAGVHEFVGYAGVIGGSLTIDGTRQVRRQGGMQLASLETTLGVGSAAVADRDTIARLTTEAARLTVEWGIRFPDLTEEWIQVATLRVEETTFDSITGDLNVTSALDLGGIVTDATIIVPFVPYVGATPMSMLDAIVALVNDAYPASQAPTWSIDPALDAATPVPDGTVLVGDRWTAIQNFASALNADVYCDHAGTWQVQAAGQDRTPVWHVTAGEDGVLVGEVSTFTRRDTFNAAGVRWESPDKTTGLVFVTDDDPASPTYWQGPFGKKPRPEETNQTITTEEQARARADALLASSKGRARGIALTTLHMPLLEPGDVIGVFLPDGTAERHVLDSMSLPLGPGGTMTMQTRLVRGGVTYNEPGVVYEDSRFTYAGGNP